jgi:putative ABC transport system substrate-binding protein
MPAAMCEEYHAPIGRSGPGGGYRIAAIWSLVGVKRKSKPKFEMTRLTHFDIPAGPIAVVHNRVFQCDRVFARTRGRIMRRREFLTRIAGAAAAWPIAARAQPSERIRRIGVLVGTDETDLQARARLSTFAQRLQQLGWIEGRDIQVEYRWSSADLGRIRANASQLVALSPDVILSVSSPALAALQRETRTVPIVFVAVFDPVEDGFVASMSRPGGNVTGFTPFDYAITGKWLELLKEIAPGVARVLVLGNQANRSWPKQLRMIEAVAPSFTIKPIGMSVGDAPEIEHAIQSFVREVNGGLLAMPDNVTIVHRELILRLAGLHRLPAVYPYRLFAVDGGLMSYGPDNTEQYRQAAGYVDRILKGEKPADLPVQAPTKYELVVNLKTARALGVGVPPMLLARADEVIE